MIEENVKNLLALLKEGNCYGEKVTLIAATKTRSAEEINRAIRAGVTDIGENKVQEFTAKYSDIEGASRHFIGRLQTNKVKYLIGKTALVHSLDRDALAEEIARRSLAAGICTDVLIEVNLGEESKGGYPLASAYEAFLRLRETRGLRVRGFMAMLPEHGDRLEERADAMRRLYEQAKKRDENVTYLSMGMSGDWQLCLAHGSNMIRLGTAIFGQRNYDR